MGDDTLQGDAGADTMYGNAGADTFIQTAVTGDTTGDLIYGGSEAGSSSDSDTVDYSALSTGVTLRLFDTGLTNVTVGSSVNDHQLSDIENIRRWPPMRSAT